MKTKIKEILVKDYLTKSNLPFCDYVINPYVGCPHACKYCYASFMKRFTNHKEPWGDFIDIKLCEKNISKKKLIGKSVFLSSVTDPYNICEKKYELTRKILSQLLDIDCKIYISTKSDLILRDMDLLKQQKNLTVAISINTLNENFRCDMDNASSISERLMALKELYNHEIKTVLFMSPIFPEITNYESIISQSKDFIKEYWFENLNLRGGYKKTILDYIYKKYTNLFCLYHEIYQENNIKYWLSLEKEIINYCNKNKIKYINAFYHKKLVQEKR